VSKQENISKNVDAPWFQRLEAVDILSTGCFYLVFSTFWHYF